MPVRGVVVPEHSQCSLHAHSRRIHRHQQHGLLVVFFSAASVATFPAATLLLRTSTASSSPAPRRLALHHLPHDDGDAAARVQGARRPPLGAVDDVAAAGRALERALDVPRVAGGHGGFRHEKGAAGRALDERGKPLRFLGVGAVAEQHLHVPRVGGGAVAGLRRQSRTPSDLCEHSVLGVGQPGTLRKLFWEPQIPKPPAPCLGFQTLQDGTRRGGKAEASGRSFSQGFFEFLLGWYTKIFHELLQ
mmetsp:Transcript_84344/g.168874  ORF Transcript_84344/g.168874 Transcript_84344/m.168874 type:complete len:247 (+) Transcript_84344:765-1505(+)